MTFQEWRERYRGIHVTEDKENPGVFMVSDRNLPGTPLADLFELSDYWVTSDALKAHYGPTVWLAPRDEARKDWTRADYMNHRVDHHRYYLSLADALGRDALVRIVGHIADRPTIKRRLEQDKHLNNIPLARWDGMHSAVLGLVREAGSRVMARSWSGQPLPPKTVCWSLSESVCVLKAVARDLAQAEA